MSAGPEWLAPTKSTGALVAAWPSLALRENLHNFWHRIWPAKQAWPGRLPGLAGSPVARPFILGARKVRPPCPGRAVGHLMSPDASIGEMATS